ncbi:MAG: restriction endonuclease subunit S, partial [Bacilli bacterium]|nr:restriction endonuclease subunit S [Bacilli bacterium]
PRKTKTNERFGGIAEMKIVKLGDVATFINGYAFKPKDWSKKGLEIIRIQNLTRTSKESNFFEGKIDEKYLVKKGDILISWSATLGVYEWKSNDAWLNQHIFKVVFDKVEIDKSYFKHLMSITLNDMNRKIHGATMKHITKSKFDNITIPLPSLSEQQRIAKILDTADALRKTNEELLQNYNDLQKAIFAEMFGDPVSNEKGWEVKELIDITKKIGSGSTPTGGKKSYNLTGISLIRSLNIHDNLFKYDNLAFINDLQAKKLNNVTVLENDVLFNITGASVCRCTIVPNDVVPARVNQHVAIIRVKETKLTPHFLSYLLTNSSEKTLLLKLAKQNGATREAITKDQLEKISLIVPPISLQNQFTKIIENIEQQKDISRKSMEYSEELFAALVQELFRFEK